MLTVHKHLPSKDLFLNKPLPQRPEYIIEEYIGTGNNGHVFRARSEAIGRDIACKIIPRTNLHGQWTLELNRPNALRNSAVVRYHDVLVWADTASNIDCV